MGDSFSFFRRGLWFHPWGDVPSILVFWGFLLERSGGEKVAETPLHQPRTSPGTRGEGAPRGQVPGQGSIWGSLRAPGHFDPPTKTRAIFPRALTRIVLLGGAHFSRSGDRRGRFFASKQKRRIIANPVQAIIHRTRSQKVVCFEWVRSHGTKGVTRFFIFLTFGTGPRGPNFGGGGALSGCSGYPPRGPAWKVPPTRPIWGGMASPGCGGSKTWVFFFCPIGKPVGEVFLCPALFRLVDPVGPGRRGGASGGGRGAGHRRGWPELFFFRGGRGGGPTERGDGFFMLTRLPREQRKNFGGGKKKPGRWWAPTNPAHGACRSYVL